jgi:CubicO group peptidase (beta-lactamase class C family)
MIGAKGAALAILLAAAPLADPVVAQDRLAAAESVFTAEFDRRPIGSLTIGVVEHGRLVWTRSYGSADIESRRPANRETVYRIGSITKQFTALALLQLVAEGRVRLDDAASRYLPELGRVRGFARYDGAVSLLSLATHRAGLAREPDVNGFTHGPINRWQSILRQALAHTSLEFTPNDEAVYSNIGYAALGLAIEDAAATPYIDLIERRVLAPLGMTSTTFRPSAGMLARLAKGYEVSNRIPDPREAQRELHNGRGYKIPNGGLFSTVDDLAKFMSFEMSYGPAQIVAPGTLTGNFARSYPMRGGARYGIGFMEEHARHRVLLGHDGEVTGYTSSAFFDPTARLGIICLRSADYGCEGAFLQEAFDALEGQ